MRTIGIIFALLFALSGSTFATTWDTVSLECPICKFRSDYLEVTSYGSYIYQWESKYQYVFWPLTDDASVYCCPHCFYSALMWDFKTISVEKISTVKAVLESIESDSIGMDYRLIPATTRLLIAQRVYEVLDRDKKFWCRFYWVLGYHYAAEENSEMANRSRGKAVSLAKEMLIDTTYQGQEKETLFIIAAMYNYMYQKDSSRVYLNKASVW